MCRQFDSSQHHHRPALEALLGGFFMYYEDFVNVF